MIHANACFSFEYESAILARVWPSRDLGGVVFEHLAVVRGLWSAAHPF